MESSLHSPLPSPLTSKLLSTVAPASLSPVAARRSYPVSRSWDWELSHWPPVAASAPLDSSLFSGTVEFHKPPSLDLTTSYSHASISSVTILPELVFSFGVCSGEIEFKYWIELHRLGGKSQPIEQEDALESDFDVDTLMQDPRAESQDDFDRTLGIRRGIDLATTLERIEKNFVITDPRLPDNPIVSTMPSSHCWIQLWSMVTQW